MAGRVNGPYTHGMARHVSDPAVMRAVAHPLRLQILDEMWDANRPLRAADLAEILEQPANSISYHVRKLRDAGYVVDVDGPEGSTARDHWYAAPQRGIRTESETGSLAAAAAAVTRTSYAQHAETVFAAQHAELSPQMHIDGLLWLPRDVAGKFVERFSALAKEMREASFEALETAEDGTPFTRFMFLTDLVPSTRNGERIERPVEEVPGMDAERLEDEEGY